MARDPGQDIRLARALRLVDALDQGTDAAVASAIAELVVANNPQLALVAPLLRRGVLDALGLAKRAAGGASETSSGGLFGGILGRLFGR